MPEKNDQGYFSFLLRIWVEETNGKRWRFSLEDSDSGRRKGFASLDKLIAFLAQLLTDANEES